MSYDEKNESQTAYRKRKNRTLKVLVVIIFIALLAIAANVDVMVKWFITSPPLTIVLTHPNDDETINVATDIFNWVSAGGWSGAATPRYHVWYLDSQNTFNTPLKRAIYVSTDLNYIPAAMEDGDWYWRAEVTDNRSVEVSLTRHLIVLTDIANHFPSLVGPTVFPDPADNSTNFTYSVVFVDPDNDTASYVRVYIDGIAHAMTENDSSDINTTDGKIYDYHTLLSVGLHNYSFVAFDGVAIYATVTYVGPEVTLYVPAVIPPGGGGGGGGEKMNKITLQPENTEITPGETFRGSLSITEESYDGEYEVYWYIYLLDENDNEITFNQGSLAISTTVVIPYNLTTNISTPVGTYRILAKTYDRPREQIAAVQLGMDEIYVGIGEAPPGPEPPIIPVIPPFKDWLSDFGEITQFSVILGLMAAGIIILFAAFHYKKYLLLLAAIACIMMDLLFIGLIPQNEMTFFGVPLVIFGGFLLTPHRAKIIKNKHFAIALGTALVVIGLIMYLSSFMVF
jgi:hypothetical protein